MGKFKNKKVQLAGCKDAKMGGFLSGLADWGVFLGFNFALLVGFCCAGLIIPCEAIV